MNGIDEAGKHFVSYDVYPAIKTAKVWDILIFGHPQEVSSAI